MLPAAPSHGGDSLENQTKIRHVSTSTTTLRGDGADGVETVLAGNLPVTKRSRDVFIQYSTSFTGNCRDR